MSKDAYVDALKRLAASAPPDKGVMPSGRLTDTLGCKSCAMIILDDRGRAFAVTGAFQLSGAQFHMMQNARRTIGQIMDRFGTLDVEWPDDDDAG